LLSRTTYFFTAISLVAMTESIVPGYHGSESLIPFKLVDLGD
jgi:hypothetical protein